MDKRKIPPDSPCLAANTYKQHVWSVEDQYLHISVMLNKKLLEKK
jgi:hypothetical protein